MSCTEFVSPAALLDLGFCIPTIYFQETDHSALRPPGEEQASPGDRPPPGEHRHEDRRRQGDEPGFGRDAAHPARIRLVKDLRQAVSVRSSAPDVILFRFLVLCIAAPVALLPAPGQLVPHHD